MLVYIVTYDLNKESSRPPIVKKIKEYGNWAKLSESSYAIATTHTVEQVYENLKSMIDSNDNIFIVTLKKPYTGFGPKDVIDWLDSNLPY